MSCVFKDCQAIIEITIVGSHELPSVGQVLDDVATQRGHCPNHAAHYAGRSKFVLKLEKAR
jgi:hypothetical protein